MEGSTHDGAEPKQKRRQVGVRIRVRKADPGKQSRWTRIRALSKRHAMWLIPLTLIAMGMIFYLLQYMING